MKNKRFLSLICFTVVFLAYLTTNTLAAVSVRMSSKLKKISDKFSADYTALPTVSVPAVVACFPFQADEKLAKRKIDFAIGEMFARQLIETGSFKIVERVELKKILEEQSLGLSGAIETESAVEVGQLLGTQLLIMGSIARMGKSYQINARLVDTQTGEVISMDFAEINVKAFEEEAGKYIELVPEKQAIGLQFLVIPNFFIDSVTGDATLTGLSGDYTSATVTPEIEDKTGYLILGLGARYFPYEWLAVEGAYFLASNHEPTLITNYANTTGSDHVLELAMYINVIRIGALYTRKAGKNFRIYAGANMVFAIMGFDEETRNSQELGYSVYEPLSARTDLLDNDGMSVAFPTLRLGGEWRPQPRIGISLLSNIALGTREFEKKITIEQHTGPDLDKSTEMDFFTVKIPALTFELAFAFYF
ncbi:CsgG/HfaB family protein [Elusimicrobiota bacterium]